MSVNDSYVVVGTRKSLLPRVYVGAESETGASNLRKRSGGDTGSEECSTPSSVVSVGVSTPHQRTRYGVPGCTPSIYQPHTPVSAHSVFDSADLSSPRKTRDETINMDSGYGGHDYYSSKSKKKSTSELWDSVVMTPVNNLKKKLRKRPSFVDEDKQWQLETDKLLGWLLVILIVFSFLMAGFITYAAFRGPVNHNFNNGKYNSIKYARERLIDEVEEIDDVEDIPSLNRNFLLKEDITIEEVLERKRKLEDDYYDREEVFIEEEEEDIYEDVPRDFNNVEEDRVRQAENMFQETSTMLRRTG